GALGRCVRLRRGADQGHLALADARRRPGRLPVCGLLRLAHVCRRAREGRGCGTTRHASAAPGWLGSISARLVRVRLEGTGPATPPLTRPPACFPWRYVPRPS